MCVLTDLVAATPAYTFTCSDRQVKTACRVGLSAPSSLFEILHTMARQDNILEWLQLRTNGAEICVDVEKPQWSLKTQSIPYHRGYFLCDLCDLCDDRL
jgi:hypothetical protein